MSLENLVNPNMEVIRWIQRLIFKRNWRAEGESSKMASLVEEAIADAIQSLMKRDSDLAQKTIASDEDQINDLEIAIEEMCLKLLALRQPMAIDLRFITAAMKIITDLERMGDQAVNIAERAISLNQEPQLKPYIDIPRMAEITQTMVKDVLDAFVNRTPSWPVRSVQGMIWSMG